jgi:hypothetical protein
VQQVSAELAEAARQVGFWGAVTKLSGTEVVQGVAAIVNHGTYFAVDESASA